MLISARGADVDEQSKREIKDILLNYDRTLLVADPRRCEPKKCAYLSCCLTQPQSFAAGPSSLSYARILIDYDGNWSVTDTPLSV